MNRDDKPKYIGKIREYRANAGFSYGEVFVVGLRLFSAVRIRKRGYSVNALFSLILQIYIKSGDTERYTR